MRNGKSQPFGVVMALLRIPPMPDRSEQQAEQEAEYHGYQCDRS